MIGRSALPGSLLLLLAAACTTPQTGQAPLSAEVPIHLEAHLGTARIEGSEVPGELPEPVEWGADDLQTDWKPAQPMAVGWEAARPLQADGALRLLMTETTRNPRNGRLLGEIYVALPGWRFEDWSHVEIRARTRDPMANLGLQFNYTEADPAGGSPFPFRSTGDHAPLVTDGETHTYRLSLDASGRPAPAGAWSHLAIWFNSRPDVREAAMDILSIRVIPRETEFAGRGVGVRTVAQGPADGRPIGAPLRRSLYMHAPGRILYRVRIPEEGRLDVGLGVLGRRHPVTFRVTAQRPGGGTENLFEERYARPGSWGQRSIDLARLAGEIVTLALAAEADRAGTVALWAAPTLSGERRTDRPNVIFYVIDGGSAGHMSGYGYNRRTTPNLERLAAEGALFEHAYSNSWWTKPSTMSFMTSLHHSVLGSLTDFDPLPEDAVSMAQHMHRAGYQTAVFTSNPLAGSTSDLQRGVDVFRDSGMERDSTSSAVLQRDFWSWRAAYPGEPYWVHFQTTDVHPPYRPAGPFAGLYLERDGHRTFDEWKERLLGAGGFDVHSTAYERTGLSRGAFFDAARDLYDETLAHQDDQLGRLVERLKARGEWERTLLIVAADHGIVATGLGDVDLGLLESPPPWNSPVFRPSKTRVPLIVVWPGRIPGGQRFTQAVSMIDVLPTVLDLVGLPQAEPVQGQSLAPLLLGEDEWEPRPVIFDWMPEFHGAEDEYELSGYIAVIDGRWGASLEINPPPGRPPELRRPTPLLLYDLWDDPMALQPVNDERPELVEEYAEFLKVRWRAHQALAKRFTRSERVQLSRDQLEALRALGYLH